VQEATNRLDVKMRVIEGQAGQVRAFLVPRQSPKTCQERVYEIKPLCLVGSGGYCSSRHRVLVDLNLVSGLVSKVWYRIPLDPSYLSVSKIPPTDSLTRRLADSPGRYP